MDGENLKAEARWIAGEWISRLAAAISTMTDSEVEASPDDELLEPPPAGLAWYLFALSAPDAVVAAGAEPAMWSRLGSFALAAAGLTEPEPGDIESTTVEMLNQAGSGLAQTLARRLGRDVTAKPAAAAQEPPPSVLVAASRFPLGEGPPLRVLLAVSPAAASLLLPAAPEPAGPEPAAAPSELAARRRKTLDLLMEVELPVSVSFGRAYIALRDVIKLNSGSIVELNRTVHDPVEIIVNNCVIARGEVVVVDGNYGVRIQQVISREERLRTLN